MKKQFFSALLVILAFAPLGCFSQQEPSVPTQEIKAVGLKAKVIIRRDERGIPYLEAANDSDLYFAQGYVTAQDRLWQMDLLRRVARGQLAEIFGRQPTAAGTIVDEDKRWRKYGFAGIAEQTLPLLAPELRAALTDYARGVNAYIATLDEKSLPPEFKILQYRPAEWQPTDSIVIGKILADGLSTTWRFDLVKASLQNLPAEKLKQLYNNVTPDDVLLIGKDSTTENGERKMDNGKYSNFRLSQTGFAELSKAEMVRKSSLERVGLYAEDLAASNNWVISGKRTADGKPILANDPHLPASVPSVWYLVNLNSPNVNAAGVSLPGAPGIILGHNANIAWGATNVGPDVQDLYLEQFNPANSHQYKTPQGWQDAKIRREEIKIRKSPVSPETETETLEVTETRHGPVYFEDGGGQRYALRWTAFDPNNNEFEAFFFLNRARNWEDFRAALKRYGGSMQNFVFADTTGNIGWYAAGRVPLRKTGDGSVPYDGATDAGEWTGTIPFEELPNLYNPPENLIVTANQRIVGKSYKYQGLVRDFAAPYRARRIYNLLSANPKITVENVNEIQHDIFNIPLSRFAREVVASKAASEDTLKNLGAWDGKMSADSRAALLASEMQTAFSKRILDANLSQAVRAQFRVSNLMSFLDRLIAEKPADWLPKEFANYADLLKSCEKDARDNLTKKLGADETKWTWGEANKIRFAHPLAAVPFIGGQFAIAPLPLNGGSNSPNVGSNVSMRLIATPANWDATRHGIAVGESGLPNSPYYKDQLDSWYKGISPIFPFSQTAIKKAAKDVIVLMP